MHGVKWKLLGIETAVVKGFFSKISILGDKWLLKIAKKMRKCVFLFNGLELERVIQFRPPLFFNFRGGHTSSILSNSCSFLRYAFLGLKFIVQNNDFWEKSFYYSSFYAQKLSFDSRSTHFWNSSTNPSVLWTKVIVLDNCVMGGKVWKQFSIEVQTSN